MKAAAKSYPIHPFITYILIGVVLTIIISAIDFIGVKAVDYNGLVFKVHIYWFYLSFWVASGAFTFAIFKVGRPKNVVFRIFQGLTFSAVWWALTFWYLMAGFHGAMGGWY